jgi:hypothetical protein
MYEGAAFFHNQWVQCHTVPTAFFNVIVYNELKFKVKYLESNTSQLCMILAYRKYVFG